MKKRCNFTIDSELIEWFQEYAKKEARTMSSLINSHILELKKNKEGISNNTPSKNVLKVKNN